MSIKLVSRYEPPAIQAELGWAVSDIAPADYFLFLDTSLLTVNILRRTAEALLTEISSGMIQNNLATVKWADETILIVEGALKCNKDNRVELNSSSTGFAWSAYVAFSLSIQRQGIMVLSSPDMGATTSMLKAIARHYEAERHNILRRKASLIFEVTPQIEFLCGLPGISLEVASRLLATYGDPLRALQALLSDEEIPFIPTRQRNRIVMMLTTKE